MLKVQHIEKYYGSKNNVTKALDRVSLEVADGEFLVIMGASGSGKPRCSTASLPLIRSAPEKS